MSTHGDPRARLADTALAERALFEVKRVIVGQDRMVERMMVAVLARGHCLLEGVPGIAKTLAAETLATVIGGSFARIQFTPDLVPSDIVGTRIYRLSAESFDIELGPVMANIVLADEINRAPAKVQSALLEVMAERQVSIGGRTFDVPLPFLVLATQNPIELEGTYPLPEAQLDRFMFNIVMSYLSEDDEVRVVTETTQAETPKLERVLSGADIQMFQQAVRHIAISDDVARYAVRLVDASRPTRPDARDFVKQWVKWGAGLRASQALVLASKARALISGRFHVSVSDIRTLALPTLRHRIITTFYADSEQITPDSVIQRLLDEVPAPKSGL